MSVIPLFIQDLSIDLVRVISYPVVMTSHNNINKELYAPELTIPQMSSEPEQPSDAHSTPDAEIARLKRRLAASQDEVKELTQGKAKKPPCADFEFEFALLPY